jgi:serine/threonine protein kinase
MTSGDDTIGAADTEAEVGRGSAAQRSWALDGYDFKEVIGKGGMGEVVLARDTRMERDVAIKRMLSEAPSAESEARFLREAKIQATLDHPAIVPVHQLGTDDNGRPYFVMKRLVGTTLQAKLDAGAPMRPLLRALVDVCQAVDRAHSYGIVHRDLKPSNIMLGDYGEVYVLDWGVARVIGDRGPVADLSLASPSDDGTKTGQMLGTPGYMAPEQMLGQDVVGPPADVYALGAILFEILAGVTLHPRGHEAIPSTLSNSEIQPSKRAGDRPVPPELDQLCKAALETSAALRPTARSLGDEIQRYLDGDRDLERRRELANTEFDGAQRAFSNNDRANAMRHAGRAIYLDPSNTAAAELASRLVLDVPAELPPELEARLAQEEVRQMRERSGRAIPAILAFFAFLLIAPVLGVENWSSLLFVALAMAGHLGISYISWKIRPLPVVVYVGYQAFVLFAFSRFAGPFVFTPVLACGILLSFTSLAYVNDRPWLIVAWCVGAMLFPYAAEYVGIAAQTWHLGSEGIVSYGSVFTHGDAMDRIAVIAGNIACVVAIGMFGRGIARDRRIAQRSLFAQAWHLEQLLPKARTMP